MFLPCRPCCGPIIPGNCGVSIGATAVYAHITASDYQVRFSTTRNSTLSGCSSGSGYAWAYYFPGDEYNGVFSLSKISAVISGTLGQSGSSYTETWRYYYPDTAVLCFDPQSYLEVESSLRYVTTALIECKVIYKSLLYGFRNCDHADPSFTEDFTCTDLGCADFVTPNAGACFLKTTPAVAFSKTVTAYSPSWTVADLEALTAATGTPLTDTNLRCAYNTLCGTLSFYPSYSVDSRTGSNSFSGYVEFSP